MENLKFDCRIYWNLCIFFQAKEDEFEELFTHKNHAFPASISGYGKLSVAQGKLDFTQYSREIVEPQYAVALHLNHINQGPQISLESKVRTSLPR